MDEECRYLMGILVSVGGYTRDVDMWVKYRHRDSRTQAKHHITTGLLHVLIPDPWRTASKVEAESGRCIRDKRWTDVASGERLGAKKGAHASARVCRRHIQHSCILHHLLLYGRGTRAKPPCAFWRQAALTRSRRVLRQLSCY